MKSLLSFIGNLFRRKTNHDSDLQEKEPPVIVMLGELQARRQTYVDALAGAMRSDPDVLMVGEIRLFRPVILMPRVKSKAVSQAEYTKQMLKKFHRVKSQKAPQIFPGRQRTAIANKGFEQSENREGNSDFTNMLPLLTATTLFCNSNDGNDVSSSCDCGSAGCGDSCGGGGTCD